MANRRPPGRRGGAGTGPAGPPRTGGTGRGTPHRGPTTGNCMLAKAIGATILAYLAIATLALFGQVIVA